MSRSHFRLPWKGKHFYLLQWRAPYARLCSSQAMRHKLLDMQMRKMSVTLEMPVVDFGALLAHYFASVELVRTAVKHLATQ